MSEKIISISILEEVDTWSTSPKLLGGCDVFESPLEDVIDVELRRQSSRPSERPRSSEGEGEESSMFRGKLVNHMLGSTAFFSAFPVLFHLAQKKDMLSTP